MAQPTSLYVSTSTPPELDVKVRQVEKVASGEIATLRRCAISSLARVTGALSVGWPPRRQVARVDCGR